MIDNVRIEKECILEYHIAKIVLLHANFVNFLAQTSRKLREDSTIHDTFSASSTELQEVPESVEAAEKSTLEGTI